MMIMSVQWKTKTTDLSHFRLTCTIIASAMRKLAQYFKEKHSQSIKVKLTWSSRDMEISALEENSRTIKYLSSKDRKLGLAGWRPVKCEFFLLPTKGNIFQNAKKFSCLNYSLIFFFKWIAWCKSCREIERAQ